MAEEKKIAIFSVLKKDSILKNIFLNSPPLSSNSSPPQPIDQEDDPPILIGRHPDCHIVLHHPSISRFHLEVRIKPMSQKFSVIDLSSVHGTWVSGIKIQSRTPVDLVDGNILKLGASTRFYRLQWVPLCRALEMEGPLEPLIEEKEETYRERDKQSFVAPMQEPSSEKRILSSSLLSRRNKYVGFLQIPNGSSKERIGGDLKVEANVEVEMEEEYKESGINEVHCVNFLGRGKKGEEEEEELFASAKENLIPELSLNELQWLSSSLHTAAVLDVEEYVSQDIAKENGQVETSVGLKLDGLISKDIIVVASDEEEVFGSDKENLTPGISCCRESLRSYSIGTRDFDVDEDKVHSDRETMAPKILRDLTVKEHALENYVEDEREEETSASIENMTPEISYHQKLQRSPSAILSTNVEEDNLDVENWALKVLTDLTSPISDTRANNVREESVSNVENLTPAISCSKKLEKSHNNSSSIGAKLDEENGQVEAFIGVKLDGLKSKDIVKDASDEEEVFASDEENLTPGIFCCRGLWRSYSDGTRDFNVEEDEAHSDRENVVPEREEDTTASMENMKLEISHHQKLQISPNAISSTNMEEDILHLDVESWASEVLADLKSPIFNNCANNEREESVSDMENLTPAMSCSKKVEKSHKFIAVLNREEEMVHSDEGNCTLEVPTELKLKKRINGGEETCGQYENLKPEISFGLELENSQMDLQKSSPNVSTTLRGADEVLSSDRENCTPKVPRNKKLKTPISKGGLKNDGQRKASGSEKENVTPDNSGAMESKKPLSENCARIEREIMKQRVERIPLQLLLDGNSLCYDQMLVEKGEITDINHKLANKSSVSPVQRRAEEIKSNLKKSVDQVQKQFVEQVQKQSVEQVLCKVGKEKKWNIVVDTSCFLDEESRKSLQLLEGLRGTHLIIPRIVIRELDCLKRHESWFRKATNVSSALQWIRQCMVRTSWWIHIQSSSKALEVASTPPASPNTPADEGSNEFGSIALSPRAFSTCGSLMEIVSPTAEDHILHTALLFKKIKIDGQLILLTNNISQKIKAMAEGLLCETPKEFRDSLVSPYSKRFLWVESSPRGSTWPCTDQMVMIENYYHQCQDIRKMANVAEGPKGLKLILLHTSQQVQPKSIK